MFYTFTWRLFHVVNIVVFYIKVTCKKGGQSDTKLGVLDCLSDPLTVLVSPSEEKEVEQLQSSEDDESLIVSSAAAGVSFNSSTTLTAVTLADGTQAFVAEDINLDAGSVQSDDVPNPIICNKDIRIQIFCVIVTFYLLHNSFTWVITSVCATVI